MKLTLFGTLDCHLCEQAIALLDLIENVELKHVDIAGSETLVDQYGIRIPVVKKQSGAELGWPFDLQELERFICENNESV
ncbi:MAG: glutaredoxin family protein [Gammaproteobacteria bacterium]